MNDTSLHLTELQKTNVEYLIEVLNVKSEIQNKFHGYSKHLKILLGLLDKEIYNVKEMLGMLTNQDKANEFL